MRMQHVFVVFIFMSRYSNSSLQSCSNFCSFTTDGDSKRISSAYKMTCLSLDSLPISSTRRVAQKMAQFWYALTLQNINRFSKLFHCQNREKICNKDPTTPQLCCYTTLWNVKCLKSNNVLIISVIVQSNCHILQLLQQLFNVSALLLNDALLKCVVTEVVVLFSFVAFMTLDIEI